MNHIFYWYKSILLYKWCIIKFSFILFYFFLLSLLMRIFYSGQSIASCVFISAQWCWAARCSVSALLHAIFFFVQASIPWIIVVSWTMIYRIDCMKLCCSVSLPYRPTHTNKKHNTALCFKKSLNRFLTCKVVEGIMVRLSF